MKDIYEEMIAASRDIAASFPQPRFYVFCREPLNLSHSLFDEDAQVMKCRTLILSELKDDLGHGIDHSERVALEAGALAYIEGERLSQEESFRREACLLAQIAGLLHDLRRNEKGHAKASAFAAARMLQEFSISPEKGEYIVQAIANHEAFVEPKRIDSPVGQIISDALYDADKFRWGPENFTHTLWQMLRFSRARIVPLIRRFPKGMEGISQIKETFRTETGKIYGPEFIELGLKIGGKIYQFLQERFSEELQEKKIE
ncbi:MAG: HD domain-containing protein [Desulfobacterales bacterium]|jgi:hypothetical protein|nr:HD domain-containing protein [Desulfobacterales bacterium]